MSAVARPTLEEKESVLHIEKAAPGAGETLIIDGVDTGLDKNRGAREKEVYSARLYAALQETNIPRWSKESITLYVAVLCSLLCVVANGYDSSLMSAILAMPHFQRQFGTQSTGALIGVVNSMYAVGSAVSPPLSAIVSDRYGRRRCMFVGATIILLGMLLVSTAQAVGQLIAGRFVLGAGVAFTQVGSAAYSMEIAPPHWRGRATGLYNCGWFLGSIPAAAVCFGTTNLDSNLSWQIPFVLQAVAASVVSVLVWYVPESPRFQMANGREDLAWQFLVTYHGNNDPNSALVALELDEMKEGIVTDGSDKRWWDWRPLFSNHNGRWRSTQVLMMSVFGQFTGNGLGYYNTVIFANLGIKTVSGQLGFNLLRSVTDSSTGILTAFYNDRLPRRRMLVYGTLACSAMLALNAGLSDLLAKEIANGGTANVHVAGGALAAFFLYGNAYAITYTPLQAVVPTEALESTSRAKGLAMSGVIVNCMVFINLFAGPIALKNIGYKYIWVYVGWACVEALFWWLFGVESQGRTLEELEWIYNQPNPVKASLKLDKVIVADDGRVAEIEEAHVPV